MLTRIVPVALLVCLSLGLTAAQDTPLPPECDYYKSKQFREVVGFLASGLNRQMFTKNGISKPEGYFYFPTTSTDPNNPAPGKFDTICYTPETKDVQTCEPASAPKISGMVAPCKYQGLNVKANIRVTEVDIKPCAFETCEESSTKTKTEKTELHGSIKGTLEIAGEAGIGATGKVSGKAQLEALLGGSSETTITYSTTTKTTMKKDQSARLLGISVQLTTSVNKIISSGYDDQDKTNPEDCREDKYIENGPTNSIILTGSRSKTVWLNLDCEGDQQKDSPPPAATKRQLQEEDCFYFDEQGNLMMEPCPI
ncbi:hypothetical protein BGZ51_003429 [Haplosporangium sp. Z 767]|nr:hypothetical protein BGZ50_009696 [Haplosporangium sp. Z 11]KAF9193378.1 hypothetical protein BGZ51_003429 [Haplosporangium sp. Z 767]